MFSLRVLEQWSEDQIVALFEHSKLGQTVVDWERSRFDVLGDHGQYFLSVDDHYYEVDDPESSRLFAIVEADPGVDGSGLDFEEL